MENVSNTTTREQITNPYAQETRAEYKMGTFEKFLHDTLGFRTGIDQYNENMDNAAREWETQNQSLAYEENYNSPEAQAERMRQAGLNPDIAPNQITPGEAGEMTEPESAMISPAGQDMEILQTAGEGVAKIGTAIIGMLTGSQALTLGSLTLDAEEMRNAETMLGIVDQSMGVFPELEEAGAFSGLKEDEGTKNVLKMLGLSGRNARKFEQARKYYLNTIPGKIKARDRAIAEKDSQTLYSIADTVNMHSVKSAENALYMEERMNELMQKYPKLVDESILSNWKKGIFEASKAGSEAGIMANEKEVSNAEKEARKIYGEYKEIQAKSDKETLERYHEILEEGNYWLNPKEAIEFHAKDRAKRNADRRIYGSTSQGIEDYAGDALKLIK